MRADQGPKEGLPWARGGEGGGRVTTGCPQSIHTREPQDEDDQDEEEGSCTERQMARCALTRAALTSSGRRAGVFCRARGPAAPRARPPPGPLVCTERERRLRSGPVTGPLGYRWREAPSRPAPGSMLLQGSAAVRSTPWLVCSIRSDKGAMAHETSNIFAIIRSLAVVWPPLRVCPGRPCLTRARENLKNLRTC